MNTLFRHTKRSGVTRLISLQKVLLLCCLSFFNPVYAVNITDKSWQFKVYLDDDEIGFHNFSVVRKNQQNEVYSSARFDVNFLFINVYSYRHDNVEIWKGKCLQSINAVTDDNGEINNISGKADNDAFIINTVDKQKQYSSCIKTFAYWDPAFLKETSLLNAQTGELIAVNSKFIGHETVRHKGDDIAAKRYRVLADKLQIDLWYSVNDHWLALESLTENGRIIRYTMP